MRDELFSQVKGVIDEFRFDAPVADVFDDMIRRSVPGYDVILRMLGVFAELYVTPGSQVYDLGCSLGSATLSMQAAISGRKARWVLVDSSEAMVERCRVRLHEPLRGVDYRVECADVSDVPIDKASLVVLNFTLQFLPAEKRAPLLSRIREGLMPGGVLVLSEKLGADGAEELRLFQRLHDEYRKQNGYTELEISQKRTALENVLFVESEQTHLARLRSSGFGSCRTWFRCANFASFLACRDASVE